MSLEPYQGARESNGFLRRLYHLNSLSTTMGINGLWKEIETGVSCTLKDISSNYIPGDAQNRPLRLGVDMSTLMAECTGATLAAGVNGQFHGGALYILFHKLAVFLKLPIVFIFVLDGPGRPAVKRGAAVSGRPPWWTNPAQDLIRSFGFYVHQAPGEAEAELAALNHNGLIDAVITSDSDALVFGAQFVYRTIPSQKTKKFDDEFLMYNHANLGSGFTRGGLLLFALLCGGDYDLGISQCGPAFARGLARCGFGDQLLDAACNLNRQEYTQFLVQWRANIRLELNNNSRGYLPTRAPTMAQRICDSFPKPDVLQLYLNPLTSWSPTPPQVPSSSSWILKEPSIMRLTKFCSEKLGWESEEQLKVKFRNILWEGVFLKMVYSPLRMYDPSRKLVTTPNNQASILRVNYKDRKGRFAGTASQPRLEVSAENFISLMGNNFSASSTDKFRVWVAESLLPAVMLAAVKSGGSKRRRASLREGGREDEVGEPSTATHSHSGPRHRSGIRDLTRRRHASSGKVQGVSEIIDLTQDE